MFNKLLIANRGEIACRIIRTATRLGVKTVAVYSDADEESLHTSMADEALYIGESAPVRSYLNQDAIIAAALRSGADAIHPGYGFLSENADFCRRCQQESLTFVGPAADAIEIMGEKSAAKRRMQTAGVPLLPGYHEQAQEDHLLRQAAENIGYPLLLKAVAGGGGKGMRRVDSADSFDEAVAAVRREARSAFGEDAVLVEKLLDPCRHVEVQVFLDTHGNGVYLFERDCSVQRRHQKIIEEAPAPGLSDQLRQQMGEAALRAAEAVDYVGAGTVEFLLGPDGSFYFMEMNTRLQVEHPVTEMITGQDLVAWQLMVAAGEPLPKGQQDLLLSGHAFEARIYAEDPDNDFLPAAGQLNWLEQPPQTAQVRIDTGVTAGDTVGTYYDPMISKLIVHDIDRYRALSRLDRALARYRIAGVHTNVEFLRRLVVHPAFVSGDVTTDFIQQHHAALLAPHPTDLEKLAPVAFLYLTLARRQAPSASPASPWQVNDNWRLNIPKGWQERILVDGIEHTITAEEPTPESFAVQVDGQRFSIQGELNGKHLKATIDGHQQTVTVVEHEGQITLFTDPATFVFRRWQPDLGEDEYYDDGNGFRAPMNGTVVRVEVGVGEHVNAGQTLVIMEAMKMEHAIRAPDSGTVLEVYFGDGDLVEGGSELLSFEPDVQAGAVDGS